MFLQLPDKKTVIFFIEENLLPVITTVVDVVYMVRLVLHEFMVELFIRLVAVAPSASPSSGGWKPADEAARSAR